MFIITKLIISIIRSIYFTHQHRQVRHGIVQILNIKSPVSFNKNKYKIYIKRKKLTPTG